MSERMTIRQRALLDLFTAHPDGFIYDNGGWEWRFNFGNDEGTRWLDGRVVRSLQKRKVLVTRDGGYSYVPAMSEERDRICRDIEDLLAAEVLGGKFAETVAYNGDGAILLTMEDGTEWNLNVTRR